MLTNRVAVEIALFVSLWVLYGALLNSRNLYHMGFNHGSVERLVERGRFTEKLDPDHPPQGDAFAYEGHVFQNKQPGVIFVGSLVYWPLHRLLGWTYRDTWDLTAAVVSWFTSGLATAFTALLLFRRALAWSGSMGWALACAVIYGTGTTALPFTGTLFHDTLSTLWVFAAFYVMDRRAWLSGLLLGFTPTTSLLPSVVVIGFCAYFLAQRRWRELPAFAVAFAIGILPVLVYNTYFFGSPLRNGAAIAGLWPEAMPRFDPAMMLHLARVNLRLLTWYEPLVLLGMFAVPFYPARLRREKIVVAGAIVLHLGFALSVGTEGPCSYGPRYLLPLVPFACLGLLGLRELPVRRAVAVVLVVLGIYSGVVNVVGAMYGTMFCDTSRFAFLHYADAIRHRVFYSYPLLGIEGRNPRGER